MELVRFLGDGVEAFESRLIARSTDRIRSASSLLSETEFLEQIEDSNYRDELRNLLATLRGIGFRVEWGTVGCSIRIPTAYGAGPISVAWLFPPGKSGWMGLKGFKLGFDRASLKPQPDA